MTVMYDSDDLCNRSPPLVATNPNYGEDEQSPPPFENETPAGQSRNQPEPPRSTYEGDRVLMGHLAPNQPYIAEIARHCPLDSGDGKRPTQPADFDTRELKPIVVSNLARPREPLVSHIARPTETEPPIEVTNVEGKIQFKQVLPSIQPMIDVKSEFVPKSRLHSISEIGRRASQDFNKASSPELKSRLSLQPIKSPEESSLAKSPDTSNNSQTLPSIHKALSALSDFGPSVNTMSSPYPFSSCPGSTTSGNDSPFDRFPAKFPVPASPYSHISPVSMKDSSTNPSPASHSSFWRGPSELVSAQTPYETSSMTAASPAINYPTPTEPVGVGMGERGSLQNGQVGSYKCTHPGCTAAPFQTQYLLNSHANVHSQDRPHFCPVDGCPRALGGKGFKRKNEMMRHGLVHNSPGYVCPFCPDQQHKYPRPDNLQRHVRVHHVDKNKDDPILRQVLAQRPMGSARGRKRRMNNT